MTEPVQAKLQYFNLTNVFIPNVFLNNKFFCFAYLYKPLGSSIHLYINIVSMEYYCWYTK